MIDPNTLRRAVAAAQAVLKETEPSLIVDGKPGSYTLAVYDRATGSVKGAVDSVMSALGIAGSMPAANQYYRETMEQALAKPTNEGGKAIFDLRIVPAITREARRRGLNPINHIAQLALETGYGKSIPMLPDGSTSYNAGGIKWSTVKTEKFVEAMTTEFIGGRFERVKDKFAAFPSAEAFASSYFDYLLDGPSAYRYKGLRSAKTPLEFGAVLQKGGYATDPAYATKFAKIATTVASKYSLA